MNAGRTAVERHAPTMSSPRLRISWLAIAVLAAAGWAIMVTQAQKMGNGPGTMGLTLLPFLGLWIAMMAGMMLPSVAPVAVLWARLMGSVTARPVKAARMSLFLSGYLLAWTSFGAVALAVLAGTGRLLAASPTAAKWLGVALLAGAGVYQMTPWKNWCLRRCRSPIGALAHYVRFSGRVRDLRVGIHHGATCIGCCWGLMLVLVAVGVMNVPAMAAIAAVIFTEKIWRHGPSFGRVIGVPLVVTAILAIWFSPLLPGIAAGG